MRLFLALLIFSVACSAAGPRPITIPLETLDDRLLLTQVRINGSRPLTFIVDTGAGDGTIVNRELLRELSLTEGSRQGVANPGGEVPMGRITDVTLQVGPLTLRGETLLAAPLSQFAPLLGRPVDGILGHAFLSRYAVKFDYVGRRMILNDHDRSGTPLPLTITNDMPFVDITARNHGRSVPAHVEIDTGSFETLGSNGRYVSGLLDSGDRRFEERGVAFGGETQDYRTRIDALQVGPYDLAHPAIAATTDEGGYESAVRSAGVLGAEVLRRFDLVIDYPRSVVYLKPNARFHEPWIEDATGMRVFAAPPDFRKKTAGDVFQHSAADEAGIRPGDEIVEIDGRSVSDQTIEDITRTLRNERASRLMLRRDGKTFEVTLHPRPMV